MRRSRKRRLTICPVRWRPDGPGGDGPGADERDARLMVAMAAIFGWTVFGPQLRAAFGHGSTDRAELEQRLADVLAAVVEPRRP